MKAPGKLSFNEVYEQLVLDMKKTSSQVHTNRWQGADISSNPHMATRELTHTSFRVPMLHSELEPYRQDIKPDLPWADDHFEERVNGYPINPGTHWANWAHNDKAGAAHFLDDRGMFNHNYMERYWPKFAGVLQKPTATPGQWAREFKEAFIPEQTTRNSGIMYEYGDLSDVMNLLASDPHTRQAYLPVWFPEDTGGGNKRAPCTIGYHFLMRDDRLDINYHIRSCDLYKHFRNDVYLTVRLLLWVLERCRMKSELWQDVLPGQLFMQIGSLHVFKADWDKL